MAFEDLARLTEFLHACPASQGWKCIGVGHHHGIDVPLSALKTERSCGIGEYLDLIPLIDWVKAQGMNVLQLLPLNDSGSDPSPYNALSSCALHPIYLSLHALPFLDALPQLAERLPAFSPYNEAHRVPYLEVLLQKLHWLSDYFEAAGSRLVATREYAAFVEEQPWVTPYALFKTLRGFFNHQSWLYWPAELKRPNRAQYDALVARYSKQIAMHTLMQYLSFSQLKQVKAHAQAQGVHVLGDIPLLVNAESADVWSCPDQFDLSRAAGAPPDYYNTEGQYWGFPLFCWEEIQKTHYTYWKQRLSFAAHFYDLYRIDHVLGFFRLWGIPRNRPAKEGMYFPEDEEEWEPQGRALLHMMLEHSQEMLPIAEDLGTIPECVPRVLKEMGIPGTKVMRWERAWKTDRHFLDPQTYSPLSLTCISTHDTQTLSLWWKELPEESKEYAEQMQWHYKETLSQDQRFIILKDSHHSASLFHVNLLQEYLALFPELVWPNPKAERINVPGTLLPSNWLYRFRPSMEEIAAHVGLQEALRAMEFKRA